MGTAELPGCFQADISGLDRLILVRCLRPDKLVPATAAYVSATLGPAFTEPPPFDLPGSFAEASVTSPLVFILSPGSDPTGVIIKFA